MFIQGLNQSSTLKRENRKVNLFSSKGLFNQLLLTFGDWMIKMFGLMRVKLDILHVAIEKVLHKNDNWGAFIVRLKNRSQMQLYWHFSFHICKFAERIWVGLWDSSDFRNKYRPKYYLIKDITKNFDIMIKKVPKLSNKLPFHFHCNPNSH